MKKKARKFRFARVHKIFIIIIVVLVVLRILLPYILLKYCNKSLSELKGYYGHIQDIDVSLYRGD
jgi:hypothetical protein